MGYNTDFEGQIDIDPPAPQNVIDAIDTFTEDYDNQRGIVQYSNYCDVVISEDGSNLHWNGSEKSYGMEGWVEYIIKTFLKGHTCNGRMNVWGEEPGDSWSILVDNNDVRVGAFNEEPKRQKQEYKGNM
jgi:hypothetical protein